MVREARKFVMVVIVVKASISNGGYVRMRRGGIVGFRDEECSRAWGKNVEHHDTL